MSSTLAFATPLVSPGEEQHPRRIEIVSTKAQRRARPRSVYALVAVGGLFALFIAQLLLSIVVSDGAYRIAGLQTEQRDLTRQQQSLSEHLDLLASPQNLATQAESLGMVLSKNAPVFLRLSDDTLIGGDSATGEGVPVIGANGDLVPNALLGSIPLVTPSTATASTLLTAAGTAAGTAADGAGTATATGTGVSGAPTAPTAQASVPSTPNALPSPVTR